MELSLGHRGRPDIRASVAKMLQTHIKAVTQIVDSNCNRSGRELLPGT
jgi:hypothetical protein